MNEELDKKLCTEFPRIYRDRYAPMTHTCMCWGFSHGDGWYNIIRSLSTIIQHRLDWIDDEIVREYRNINKLDYEYKLTEEERTKIGVGKVFVVADQVKEKYGTLRFYWHIEVKDEFKYSENISKKIKEAYHEIDGAEGMASVMSGVTCEDCGVPGRLRGGGWVRTLCDKHAVEEGYTDEEVEEETSDVGGEA